MSKFTAILLPGYGLFRSNLHYAVPLLFISHQFNCENSHGYSYCSHTILLLLSVTIEPKVFATKDGINESTQ